MNELNEDMAAYFRAGERGEYRVELEKATVFRLREMALRASARTKTRVTWLDLLRSAAEEASKKGIN